ncbi:hypothetical protein MMC10_001337 [Thelotrema lepadinum]|nr:hypothetical protein [Thelotrema lepadinum]
MAVMPYTEMWTRVPRPVASVALTFTFNLKTGRYDFSQTPPIKADIIDTLTRLRDFPTSKDLIGGRAFNIAGDPDQELADELLHGFRSPFKLTDLLQAIEFLFREAEARQEKDLGPLTETAEGLYALILSFLDTARPYTGRHTPASQDRLTMKKLELIDIDIAVQSGLYYARHGDEYG